MVSETGVTQAKHYGATTHLPAFLVLRQEGLTAHESLHCLTPRIMKWGQDTWIMDLSITKDYWQKQAERRQTTVIDLVEQVLGAKCPFIPIGTPINQIGGLGTRGWGLGAEKMTAMTSTDSMASTLRLRSGQTREFIPAVHRELVSSCARKFVPLSTLADHPFKALLLTEHLYQSNARGLYVLDSLFCQRLYANIKWSTWWTVLCELTHTLEQRKITAFAEHNAKTKQAQFKRFITRLCLANPHELKSAQAHAVAKRFGVLLGHVWQWAFTDYTTSTVGLDNFPWHPWQPQHPPAITRVCDTDLFCWEHLVGHLQEDLEKLVHSPLLHKTDLVLSLTWTLKRKRGQEIPLVLSFRNPHNMAKESPLHKTTVLGLQQIFQASFCSAGITVVPKRHEGNQHRMMFADDTSDPIIGWVLTISEQLHHTPEVLGLFSAHHALCPIDPHTLATHQKLKELQNQLHVPIEHFDLAHSYDPDACCLSTTNHEAKTPSDTTKPWDLAGLHRPFYVFANPGPFTHKPTETDCFLEQSMSAWWLAGNPNLFKRDYYMLINAGQNLVWAYKDPLGRWFKHGLFA